MTNGVNRNKRVNKIIKKLIKLLSLTLAIIFINSNILLSTSNESFNNNISIKLTPLQKRGLDLSFAKTRGKEGGIYSDSEFEYKTNELMYIGAEIIYKEFIFNSWDIGFMTNHSFINLNEKSKDRVEKYNYYDFQTFLYGDYFGIELLLQKYKGFYLDNPEKFEPSYIKGTIYPQRPDLEVTKFTLNYLIFNGNWFSYKAAVKQSERQNKTGLSPILMFSYDYVDIRDTSSLIPTGQENRWRDSPDLKKININTLSLSLGIGTTTGGNFYFAMTISAGIGFNHIELETSRGEKKGNSVTIFSKTTGRFILGYNSNTFFTYFGVIFDDATFENKLFHIETTSTSMEIYTGIRF